MRSIAIVLLLTRLAHAAEFYVDPNGDDTADGTSEKTAWKTLAQASSRTYEPGDQLILSNDCEFAGPLMLRGAGSKESPIIIRGATSEGAKTTATITGGEFGIDASISHVRIEGITFIVATNPLRGAVMVWADRNLQDIEIKDCVIKSNAGRGIWIAGEENKKVFDVRIHNNQLIDNAGSGMQIAKLAGGVISSNTLSGNCRKPVDEWQAGIRLWSADIRDVIVSENKISDQRFSLPKSGGMGIHIDEVGVNVEVTKNDISSSDTAGILIENTTGVKIDNNIVTDAHTGIFVYRAGHDLQITRNTVYADSLGIVLQQFRANGVNAGPEIERGGALFSKNIIRQNIAITPSDASLKISGGAEKRLPMEQANVIDKNCFGAERPYLIEWGMKFFKKYSELDAVVGPTHSSAAAIKFARDGKAGAYKRVDQEKVDAGAIR